VHELVQGQHLNVKDKRGVGGDSRHALASVAHARRYRDTTFAANLHSGNSQIPALDDLALSKGEGERLALLVCCRELEKFVSRWELLTVKNLAILLQLSDVSHAHFVTILCCWA
jgi:hypothetical protein